MEDPDRTFCKLCLVTDVKMYSLNTPSILEAYSQLLQVVVCADSQTYICYQCTSQLQKHQEFRLKCMTALNVLTSLDVDHSKISKKLIQNIDRNFFNLDSKLAFCSILVCSSNDQYLVPNNCFNTKVNYNKNEVGTELEVAIDVPAIEIKTDICETNHDTLDHFVLSDSNDESQHVAMNVCNESIQLNDNMTKNDVPKIKLEQKKLSQSKKITRKPVKNVKKSTTSVKPTKRSTKSKLKEMEWADNTENYLKEYGDIHCVTEEDAKNYMLSRKESDNYKFNPYKCELCYKGFTCKFTFDNHTKRHSSEFGSYECEYCHLRFSTTRRMHYHKKGSHMRKFVCKKCPYVSHSRSQAYLHVDLHKGKKFECNECGESFRMPTTLSSHKSKNHSKEVCELCGSTFGSLQGINAHKSLIHRQDSKEMLGPKCEECDVQFATETAWKRHLVLSSKHTVINGCSECGDTFASPQALKFHAKVHPKRTGDNRQHILKFVPPAACEICNKWLETCTEHKEHMKTAHPRPNKKGPVASPLVCEVCGDRFKSLCFFRAHERKHTGERPYECSSCGKTFRQQQALSLHEKRHTRTGAGAFQCDLCQKLYDTKTGLTKHIKGHLGIRPFECSYCHKFFTYKYEVTMHINFVHLKKPWPKRIRTKRKPKEENSD